MLNVALVGYGYWGKILRKYIDRFDKFRLVRIYHRNAEKKDIFTNDIKEILDNQEINIIFIATPIETHLEYINLFLEKNRFIFCEKPLLSIGDNIIGIKNIRYLKNIYTNYIYLVSKSIQYIKNELDFFYGKIYIEGSLKQYGNFYNSNVYEVLGVHFLSVFIYWFDIDNSNEVNIQYIDGFKDQDGIIQSGIIKIVYKNINMNINLSLISENKERKIEIITKDRSIIFDMLGDYQIKEYKYNNYKERSYKNLILKKKFDENNNLKYAIENFYNNMLNYDDTNIKISLMVQNLLNRYNKVLK